MTTYLTALVAIIAISIAYSVRRQQTQLTQQEQRISDLIETQYKHLTDFAKDLSERAKQSVGDARERDKQRHNWQEGVSERLDTRIKELRGVWEKFAAGQVERVEKLIAKSDKEFGELSERAEKALGHAGAVAPMVIVGTDLALVDLPGITYTQQIPTNLARTLRFVEQVFTEHDREGVLWDTLRKSGNGARICYARALYRLALYPNDRIEILGNGDRDELAAIPLLEHAYRLAGSDIALGRDILIRLLQAHRQMGDSDRACQMAGRLQRHAEMHNDHEAELHSKWGVALAKLQQGLGSTGHERRECFRGAAEEMQTTYGLTFGWGEEGSGRDPKYYNPSNPANLTYYTAKALWATRCTYPRDPSGFKTKRKKEHLRRLSESTDKALAFFLAEQQRYGTDPFISAIYNFCVAFILVVRKSLDDDEIGFVPPMDPKLFPQAAGLGEEEWRKMWEGRLEESLKTAEAAITSSEIDAA